MDEHDTVARARASCQRCHRRKKKCDRALPQCENCESAGVACSFLEQDQQVGSYPIAFVRGLQDKIIELEARLADRPQVSSSGQTTRSTHGSNAAQGLSPIEPGESGERMYHEAEPFEFSPMNGFLLDPLVAPNPNLSNETPASLDGELKLLSLEATAERHLGNASGLSFARLTQMVLARLSSDKNEFIFEDYQGNGPFPQDGNVFSPDMLEFGLQNYDSSLSCYPTFFGNISLPTLTDTPDILEQLVLPQDPHLSNLVEFYFAHSHSLYPIIDRREFLAVLERIRADPSDSHAQSPLILFRVWIVLAIGATTYCSVTLAEESEPISYFNKAMLYFEAALEYGDIVMLEVLMLQVSYSFFNQLGPNTWFLVGAAARIAVGMGLHSASSYENLSTNASERQKRLFFSIYMMDRVVSVALGRPSAIHDDDIDVEPFADIDDNQTVADGTWPPDHLRPSILAIPLHILALRKIASTIARKVYGSQARTATPQQRDEIIRVFHKELIDWRRNMPFPLPDIHPRVPQMSSSWFDFNFYTHLTLLYRPSPLCPTLDQHRVAVLADAAAMSIRQAVNMHRQQRFAYNWLNFLSLFNVTLALIYATTASPDTLAVTLQQTRAILDLESAMELFGIMSIKFPAAKKIRGMVEQIVTRYKDICGAAGVSKCP